MKTKNKYGYFSDDGLEYIITTPHTPRDWFNYYWNESYLACAGNSMNGFSLYQEQDGIVTNLFGKQDMRDAPRWIYIRDNRTGKIWNPGYLPCGVEPDSYKMINGLGYSILSSVKNKIEIIFRIFVPQKFNGEIWSIEVRNLDKKERDITVFISAEIRLEGLNMPYGYHTGLTGYFDRDNNMLFYQNTTKTVVDKKYKSFMSADFKITNWDISKHYFLGKTRNFAFPETVLKGKLNNSIASAEDMVGAISKKLKLNPGSSKKMNIVLGVVGSKEEAVREKNKICSNKEIEKEFAQLKKKNKKLVGGLQVYTPDTNFNMLFNVWLKHQLYLMADWARFYFKGYRDTLQDAAGMSVINSDKAIDMLKLALKNQRSDGFAPRAFRVPGKDVAEADKHYADSPTWISLATDSILRETGDISILDEVVPYSDKGKGTIWEHNIRAMEFLWEDRGKDGLSLIHNGDWNDLMDQAGMNGKGQGIWMSFALANVLRLMQQMAIWKKDKKIEKLASKRYEIIKKNILKKGWDGKWFIYSITDSGEKVGTNKSKEGKIFINPQSWAMLSGVISQDRYKEIMKVVEPKVDTKVGPIHNWPAFTKYNPNIGQLTATAPGFFTNGNVYCHAAAFKVAADYEAGRVEKAFKTFLEILPSEEKSEPYAQANGYVGPSALRMKKNVSDDPWRTGTVAWNFLNLSDRLLGFRRTFDGVYFKPMIPKKWKSVEYIRFFRGKIFNVKIIQGKDKGTFVNGKKLENDFFDMRNMDIIEKTVNVRCVV